MAVGFSLLFSIKPEEVTTSVITYYVLSIMLFQVGWAVVQIAHLSLIPEISRSHSHSSDLTAIRSVFLHDFISQIPGDFILGTQRVCVAVLLCI